MTREPLTHSCGARWTTPNRSAFTDRPQLHICLDENPGPLHKHTCAVHNNCHPTGDATGSIGPRTKCAWDTRSNAYQPHTFPQVTSHLHAIELHATMLAAKQRLLELRAIQQAARDIAEATEALRTATQNLTTETRHPMKHEDPIAEVTRTAEEWNKYCDADYPPNLALAIKLADKLRIVTAERDELAAVVERVGRENAQASDDERFSRVRYALMGAPSVALDRVKAEARAEGVREARAYILRIAPAGLVDRADVLADLEIAAERLSQGIHANGRDRNEKGESNE